MAVDADEQMERLCNKCKEEVTSDSCTRCGKNLGEEDNSFVNPNFDHDRFNRLKEGGE